MDCDNDNYSAIASLFLLLKSELHEVLAFGEGVQTEFSSSSSLVPAAIPLTWEECISLLSVLLGHMTCFGQ